MPRAVSNRALARAGSARALVRAGLPRGGARRISVGRGIVLSQGRPDAAVAWARRGVGAATVAVLDGWTAVVPTGPAYARYPYDDAVRSLAGRPVGMGMRPALGVFRLGRQVVVTVHPPRWRSVARWLIWTPRDGMVPPRGLPAASVEDAVGLVHATVALTDPAAATARLEDVLADGTLDPAVVLAEIFAELALPGIGVLTGDVDPASLPAAREVAARPRHTRAFDRVVVEENRQHAERET